MFLPVQIEVNGEEEDASKIFWIGFTDDRKTKVKFFNLNCNKLMTFFF